MKKDLKDLQNFLFNKKVEDSEVSLYFASYLETYATFDVIIDKKDAFETALFNLSKRENKLPDLTVVDPSFKYEKYIEERFFYSNANGYTQIPTDDLGYVNRYTDSSSNRLFVVGKANEVYRYLLKGLQHYCNKEVYAFGSDADNEYETAFDEVEDLAPINVASAYENEVDINCLFFNFVNIVELANTDSRVDIILLKDNYIDVQRQFVNLILNYKYRENSKPHLHIYIENEDLYNEFKENKSCVLYNEDFFGSLLSFDIFVAIRNLKEYEGIIDVTYFGDGKNNLSLAAALDNKQNYKQVLYYFGGPTKELRYDSMFEETFICPIHIEENNLSAYSAQGMIFVDTGDFKKDLVCIKSIRNKNKDIPIYWLNNDLDKMIIFKYCFLDERLYILNKFMVDIGHYNLKVSSLAYDENSEDEDAFEDMLLDYSKYNYLAYRISKDEPPFDKEILKLAKKLAIEKDYVQLKELYKKVDGKRECRFEDFKARAKGMVESIFARLEILYYLGKYAPKEEYDLEALKLAVIRYAKIIDFAGRYEFVCNSFNSLLNKLIPYFVKCDKNDENLVYIYKLIVLIYKIYNQNIDDDAANKMHMISLLFDIENNNLNRDLYLERIVYPGFDVLSFHNEDDETEFTETFVDLYIELTKYMDKANSSAKLRSLVENVINLFNQKSTTFKDIQKAFNELAFLKIEER